MTSSVGGARFTEREEAIIDLLASAFKSRILDSRIVDVHKQEGGLVATLRFMLDEVASADLERERIEASDETVEELASTVAEDLRAQVPN